MNTPYTFVFLTHASFGDPTSTTLYAFDVVLLITWYLYFSTTSSKAVMQGRLYTASIYKLRKADQPLD